VFLKVYNIRPPPQRLGRVNFGSNPATTILSLVQNFRVSAQGCHFTFNLWSKKHQRMTEPGRNDLAVIYLQLKQSDVNNSQHRNPGASGHARDIDLTHLPRVPSFSTRNPRLRRLHIIATTPGLQFQLRWAIPVHRSHRRLLDPSPSPAVVCKLITLQLMLTRRPTRQPLNTLVASKARRSCRRRLPIAGN